MIGVARLVDAALEVSVVGSFSRVGHAVRRRVDRWPGDDALPSLAGRTVLVTGATSGIGLAAARRFAARGAAVRILARNEAKASDVVERIAAETAGADVTYDLADMGDLESVRDFAARFRAANPTLDVVMHNAGALSRDFRRTPDGTELTLATHVIGPFLLTRLLLPALVQAAPARVITVTSGGMYTQRFDLDTLEMDSGNYDGTVAYARAKRAQVVLNREWAQRTRSSLVVFHAMHPGWVDTPGIEAGLPGFHRLMRPLLRTPEQGADTAVWLASAPEALSSSGDLWHDRRRRSEHRLPWTYRGDDGRELWRFCEARVGST